MKRFAIFGGEAYYPAGAMGDYITSFDAASSALSHAKAIMGTRVETFKEKLHNQAQKPEDLEYYRRDTKIEWVRIWDMEKMESYYENGYAYGDA